MCGSVDTEKPDGQAFRLFQTQRIVTNDNCPAPRRAWKQKHSYSGSRQKHEKDHSIYRGNFGLWLNSCLLAGACRHRLLNTPRVILKKVCCTASSPNNSKLFSLGIRSGTIHSPAS
jgi:hypothetical protein